MILDMSQHRQNLLSALKQIKEANRDFQFLLNDSDYFNYDYISSWKKKYYFIIANPYLSVGKNWWLGVQQTVFVFLLKRQNITLNTKMKEFEKERELFLDYWKHGEARRNEHNEKFTLQEIKKNKDLFSNIEGRQLDEQQQRAVVINEDNNLLIAAAGSGKTLTIVGKVTYLQKKYQVSSDDILLLSFTKKSAGDLEKRVGFEAFTFHKLGLNIISAVKSVKPSIFDTNKMEELLMRFFEEIVKNETTDKIKQIQSDNPSYLAKVIIYFMEYLKPYKSHFDFNSKGKYIQHLQDYNFKPFSLSNSPHSSNEKENGDNTNKCKTYKRETVKSVEECIIANYLLWNNLDYEYEKKYDHEVATTDYSQYRPDFTISQWQDKGKNTFRYREINETYKKIKSAISLFKTNDKNLNFHSFIENINALSTNGKLEDLRNVKFVNQKDDTGGFVINFQRGENENDVKVEKIEVNLKKIKIFVEHLAINEKGEVPRWFASENRTYREAKKNYHDGIKWKRKTHKKYGTVLVETYSYEQFRGELLPNLKKKLEKNGILLKPKSPNEMWELIKNQAEKEYDDLFSLFKTFLHLMKSQDQKIETLRQEAAYNNQKRNLEFLDIFEPLYNRYQSFLNKNNEIDFNDMNKLI